METPSQTLPPASPDSDALVIGPEVSDAAALFTRLVTELERFETAPPARVASTQLDGLRRIVTHAAKETGFYGRRLAPVMPGGQFDVSRWSDVPLLTRKDVQENSAGLRARTIPDAAGGVGEGQTSGSTGTPLRFARNSLASLSTRAVVERLFAWHKLDVTAPLAEIRSFASESTEPDSDRIRTGWSFRGPRAPYHRLKVSTPLERQLGWLRRVKPRYLLTYPTVARDLAAAALRQRSDPIALEAVLTVGEVMSNEVRAACRAAFGARVIDTYGCQEIGKIALQCDRSGLYHVCASSVLLEVIDDFGRPVAAGGVGKAVVTSFYNYAMPLIRYELGDYVRLASAPCPCGRSLPVIAEILGRRRNMLALPDGGRMWAPGKLLAGFGDFVPLRQYRLVQTAPEMLDLHYVPDGSGRPVDLAGLATYVRANFHERMTVRPIATDRLARSAGGKYEDVVGLV